MKFPIIFKKAKEIFLILFFFGTFVSFSSEKEEDFFLKGKESFDSNNYSASISYFDKAIELNPKNAEAYKWRARAKCLYDSKGAIDDYSKAIEINSNDKDAYILRGDLKAEFENGYMGALYDYTKVIRIDPNNIVAHNRRGSLYSLLKNYIEAINDFTKVIELDPNNLDAYYERASAKENLKDHIGSIKDYTKVIEIGPKSFQDPKKGIYFEIFIKESCVINAYNKRGLVKFSLKDYKGAIQDYSKAIEIGFERQKSECVGEYYFNRGLAKYELKEKMSALEDLSVSGEKGFSKAYKMIQQIQSEN